MVSGGRDSRRVEQQEETSGGRNVRRIAGRQRGIPASGVRGRCAVPTRQPPGQEKVTGSILLTSKMELQGASDICTAHTTKLRSPLLRCPSDMDKFLLCKPMRFADCQSIAGPPKDSGKCGPGWPLCADLHLQVFIFILQVRLEGNFSRVGWRVG
ncbi:uncharacterized protein LOC126942109 isoform X1 [Macaca thibetana thibetana]|uniref:uncharacterized protein LOC126942109 isoform X1 n=1 Tax=Macaca thibetana thibetana TaxID=257877 RepID=UPI0021BC9BF2|nr:uncharacterized protein LOC126942109 isoform X1 [Macaca thibetana thibetana]